MSNYTRTEAGEKLAKEALTKCLVWFTDENKGTFYSRDKKFSYSLPNLDIGITRLKGMVHRWGKKKVFRARIYDNNTGVELWNYKDGVWYPS